MISVTTGLQLQQGGNPVPGAIALSNANTQATFTPVAALNPATVYTIAVTAQITDVSENPLMNPTNFTFTTSAVADTTTPSVTTISPANGAAGVPTNSVIQIRFSKRIDPLTVTTADFIVFPQATSIPIPGTIAVSADGLSATFSRTRRCRLRRATSSRPPGTSSTSKAKACRASSPASRPEPNKQVQCGIF